MDVVRIIMALAIVAIALFVVRSPQVVYAPQPRVVLYFLMSMLLAILLGTEAVAQLQLKLPGFVAVSSGAAAVVFTSLWLLNRFSKPEEKIARFYVFDEHGKSVSLEWEGAVEVLSTESVLQVENFVSGNAVLLIFPEQVGKTEIRVRKVSGGEQYTAPVSYAGSRKTTLRFGRELKL